MLLLGSFQSCFTVFFCALSANTQQNRTGTKLGVVAGGPAGRKLSLHVRGPAEEEACQGLGEAVLPAPLLPPHWTGAGAEDWISGSGSCGCLDRFCCSGYACVPASCCLSRVPGLVALQLSPVASFLAVAVMMASCVESLYGGK